MQLSVVFPFFWWVEEEVYGVVGVSCVVCKSRAVAQGFCAGSIYEFV